MTTQGSSKAGQKLGIMDSRTFLVAKLFGILDSTAACAIIKLGFQLFFGSDTLWFEYLKRIVLESCFSLHSWRYWALLENVKYLLSAEMRELWEYLVEVGFSWISFSYFQD